MHSISLPSWQCHFCTCVHKLPPPPGLQLPFSHSCLLLCKVLWGSFIPATAIPVSQSYEFLSLLAGPWVQRTKGRIFLQGACALSSRDKRWEQAASARKAQDTAGQHDTDSQALQKCLNDITPISFSPSALFSILLITSGLSFSSVLEIIGLCHFVSKQRERAQSVFIRPGAGGKEQAVVYASFNLYGNTLVNICCSFSPVSVAACEWYGVEIRGRRGNCRED